MLNFLKRCVQGIFFTGKIRLSLKFFFILKFSSTSIISKEKMTVLPISGPQVQIPSSSQELIQRAIDSQDYETALTKMVLLGNSLGNKGDEPLHFLYDKSFILTPLLTTEEFEKLKMFILPNLLKYSPHLFDQQCKLSKALGNYYFEQGTRQEEQKFSLHKTALHYFIIAEKTPGGPPSPRKHHFLHHTHLRRLC